MVCIAICFPFFLRQCSFIHSYDWHVIRIQHKFTRFKKLKQVMENLELKILYVKVTFSLQFQKTTLLKWDLIQDQYTVITQQWTYISLMPSLNKNLLILRYSSNPVRMLTSCRTVFQYPVCESKLWIALECDHKIVNT